MILENISTLLARAFGYLFIISGILHAPMVVFYIARFVGAHTESTKHYYEQLATVYAIIVACELIASILLIACSKKIGSFLIKGIDENA